MPDSFDRYVASRMTGAKPGGAGQTGAAVDSTVTSPVPLGNDSFDRYAREKAINAKTQEYAGKMASGQEESNDPGFLKGLADATVGGIGSIAEAYNRGTSQGFGGNVNPLAQAGAGVAEVGKEMAQGAYQNTVNSAQQAWEEAKRGNWGRALFHAGAAVVPGGSAAEGVYNAMNSGQDAYGTGSAIGNVLMLGAPAVLGKRFLARAPGLLQEAREDYATALNPRSGIAKLTAEDPGIETGLKAGIAGPKEVMRTKAAVLQRQAGAAFDPVEARVRLPQGTPGSLNQNHPIQPIIDQLEAMRRGEVAGAGAPAVSPGITGTVTDAAKNAAIDARIQELRNLARDNPHDPVNVLGGGTPPANLPGRAQPFTINSQQLLDLKQSLDANIGNAHVTQKAAFPAQEGMVPKVRRIYSDILRDNLNKSIPEMAEVNEQYHGAKAIKKLTQQRSQGDIGLKEMSKTIFKSGALPGLGLAAVEHLVQHGLTSPGSWLEAGLTSGSVLALRSIALAMDSPAWKSTSAVTKYRIGQAMQTGRFDTALSLAKGAGLIGQSVSHVGQTPSQPTQPPTP